MSAPSPLSRRSFLKGLGLAGALAALPAAAASATGLGSGLAAVGGSRTARLASQVSLLQVQATGDRLALLVSEFDVTEHGHDGWYDVVAWAGDRLRLEQLGFRYRVLEDDLVARDITDRMAELAAQAQAPQERMTYRVLADYQADLDRLVTIAPGLVKKFELPNKTHQGRTVYGVEIGGNIDKAATDGRPQSLIMGLHHAREWPSAELTMMFAEDLVDRYLAGDAEIRSVLDGLRLFVIPVVNPDGFVRSREAISDFIAPIPGAAALSGEFAYHRKNMRPLPVVPGNSATNLPVQTVHQGVDPNRNYPYKWGGQGSSTATNNVTYHGPGPGSEPEVANILQLLRGNHVLTLITNHTYSNLVLRPFGDSRRDTPDEAQLKGLADAMAKINGYRSIKSLDLYITTGTTEDWCYGAMGTYGYTFEIGAEGVAGYGNVTPADGAGFHPQYNLHVKNFYDLNKGAFLLSLKAALDPAQHVVLEGTAPAGTVLRLVKDVTIPLSRAFQGEFELAEHIESSLPVGDDGTFTWHVNPSPMPQTFLDIEDGISTPDDLARYTVTATLPDGTTRTQKLLALRGQTYRLDFGA